ncbi:unnamed protein product [Calypogeia fissa]
METKAHKQVKECEVEESGSGCGQSVVMEMKWTPLQKYAMLFLLLLVFSFSSTVTRLRYYVLPSTRLGEFFFKSSYRCVPVSLIDRGDNPCADSGQHTEASRLGQTHGGDETFWCDRSDHRTDVCYMRGDVHLVPGNSSSLVLYSPIEGLCRGGDEIIRPYPRKWDNLTLQDVAMVVLRNERVEMDQHSLTDHSTACEVFHVLPLLVFSTGGFTGNPYHDFNDVLIPAFINSRKYRGEVVFGIVDARDWWLEKFGVILGLLTKHKIIDINATDQIHCFREATVGLRVHGDLAIFPSLMAHNETIKDFQKVLHQAYGRPESEERRANVSADCLLSEGKHIRSKSRCRLKLVLIARKQSRRILNQDQVVKLAQGEGFDVEVLEPSGQTAMKSIYRSLHSADVMIGVHGAALTHMLFMPPRSVFIQIVPLGTDWPAYTYYQEPAENRLDLQYLEYHVTPEESTLTRTYSADNLAVTDPEAVVKNNWEARKKMYLEGQDVRLSPPKVLSTLREAKKLALPQRRQL